MVALAFRNETNAEGRLVSQIESLVGKDGGQAIRTMIAQRPQAEETGTLASVLGVVTLLLGASGVFGSLQDSLNTIREVRDQKPGHGIWGMMKDRFLSFSMVLGVGFLLLVSLIITHGSRGHGSLPGSIVADLGTGPSNPEPRGLVRCSHHSVRNDLQVSARCRDRLDDVWLGSFATGLFFMVGKYAIGLYLGRAVLDRRMAQPAPFVVLLVWIFFVGADPFYLGPNSPKSMRIIAALGSSLPKTQSQSPRRRSSARNCTTKYARAPGFVACLQTVPCSARQQNYQRRSIARLARPALASSQSPIQPPARKKINTGLKTP